jgi:hypothetical protein
MNIRIRIIIISVNNKYIIKNTTNKENIINIIISNRTNSIKIQFGANRKKLIRIAED